MALVAYVGERGAYSEEALRLYFEARGMRGTESVGSPGFEEALDRVASGEAQYAFLPIENSLEGTVDEAMDAVLASDLFVVGEMRHKIDHCLVGHPGATLETVKAAYSHPYALRQCRDYLKARGIEMRPASDTATAVRELKARGNILEAAVASANAAALHGMQVLQRSIQSREHNSTRFWVLAKTEYKRNPARKEQFLTSMSFGVRNVAGALYDILGEFARRQVNLTKVESRPRPERPWAYVFQVDAEGHREDAAISEVLSALIPKTVHVQVLGSYPTWESVQTNRK